MRNRIIAALCSLSLLAPAAYAQEEQPEGEDTAGDTEAGEQGGAEVIREEGDRVQMAPPPAGGGDASAPGEVHTVVPGDTLWDLSQQYLGSPWYWPKVWSYNPDIANPHWIYPGNRVRFFPAGEEVPTRVETGTPPTEMDTGEVEPSDAFDEEMGTVQAVGKIGFTPRGTTSLLLQGFMTTRELEEAGVIEGSFAEQEILSFPETVYIRFKDDNAVKVGESYVIFRKSNEVTHPYTNERIGVLTHFVGKVKVLKRSDELVTAQITDTWDEINRGDFIGPANEDFLLRVAPRPNEKAITGGTIVEMLVPYQDFVGEHQVVMIDRGASDGVQVGNSFTVIRQVDGFNGNINFPQRDQRKKWPEESIASCMVIDVKDKFSSCLMTRSIREVLRGDRVVMKLDAQTTASR